MGNTLVSVITPNLNGGKFIEETIKSVINQSYKNFEYIVIDGGSTDESISIIKKNINKISYFISRPDNGLYYAVDEGIRKSKGDIILWINSDDVLHKNAVKYVVKIFNKLEHVNWVNGRNGYIKYGIKFNLFPYYYPECILKRGLAHQKYYGYLQQESCAFRKSLYFKCGGLDLKKKFSADYFLWKNFSNYEKLYTFDVPIGYFRETKMQKSRVNKISYEAETFMNSYLLNLKIFRFFLSLILYPYFFFKTVLLIKKK